MTEARCRHAMVRIVGFVAADAVVWCRRCGAVREVRAPGDLRWRRPRRPKAIHYGRRT